MTTRCPLDLRRLCNNTVSPCAPLCASLFYLRFHAGGTRAFGVCARYASCLTPCDRNPRGTSSLPLVPKGQDLEDRGWIEVLPHRLTPNLAAMGALQSERRLQHPTIWVGLESIGSLSDHTEKSEKHMTCLGWGRSRNRNSTASLLIGLTKTGLGEVFIHP